MFRYLGVGSSLLVLCMATGCAGEDSSSPRLSRAQQLLLKWEPAPALIAGRSGSGAVVLASGKLLVVGGGVSTGRLSSTELYDPVTSVWTDAGAMSKAVMLPAAVLLPAIGGTSKVLVTGGLDGTKSVTQDTSLFDPAGSWAAGVAMKAQRAGHCALLADGQVVAMGGRTLGSSTQLSSAEIYNPTLATWTLTGSMATARFDFACAVTKVGGAERIVVAGGYGSATDSNDSRDGVEVFAAGVWSAAGTLSVARGAAGYGALGDKLIVAGGDPNGSNVTSNAVDLCDPVTKTCVALPDLKVARRYPAAVALPNGRFLVAGGEVSGGVIADVEIYDPATSTWTALPSLVGKRYSAVAAVVAAPPGAGVPWEVVVGGGSDGSAALPTVERLRFGAGGAPCTLDVECVGKCLVGGTCSAVGDAGPDVGAETAGEPSAETGAEPTEDGAAEPATETGAEPIADTAAGGDSGPPTEPAKNDTKGACGCRTAGSPAGPPRLAALGLALLVVRWRRRPNRPTTS